MKSNFPPKNLRAASLVLVAALAALPTANAANGTWTNLASGDWSTGPWTGGVPNAASETATFSQNWAGQTINVNGNFTVGQILATDTTANGGLTISGGNLTLDNGGSSPVISTGTNNAFGESAANRLKITSVLNGTNGFERQGNGYLDLSGATNIFSGTIKLTAPSATAASFTVINSDANLGSATNVITVALNSQPVGFYNDATSGNFTLNSARTITTSGSGQFWVKNKVGANMTIAGVISGTALLRKNDSGTLTLTGANTYNGTTMLDGGTLVLAGGNNRLLANSTVTFNSVSTLDITNTNQSVGGLGLLAAGQTNTINGSGGTLIFNSPADQTWTTNATATTVNMAGLSNFTFNGLTRSFQINSNALNVVNTVNLAKAGTNTINAANVRFGGGGNFAGQNVLLGLGQNNNINASGEFVIGYFQGSGNVSFQSGLTNPNLTVRGAGGVGAIPVMSVGSTNSGNQGSIGILNLTGGSLDVIATELNVARHFANAGGTISTGTVTMPSGTVVATTLNLAAKTNTTGAPTLTGTFNQSGGTVTANTLNLGNNANSEAPNLIANYNLTGGTLYATTIQGSGATYGASTVRNLTINGGTLQNLVGGNLSVNGLDTTATGRINIVAGASGATFNADATRTITLGANTRLSGSGAVTKSGDGSLIFASGATHTYSGAFGITGGTVVVDSGANIGTAAITVGSGATLRVNGSITNAITVNGGKITGAGTLGADLGLNTLSDVVSPGNSPGIQSFGVTQNWTSFTYDWEINNFTGVAGTNFDQIAITTGGLNLTGGTSYVLNVLSLTALNTSGAVPGFSESSVSWSVVSTQSGITAFDAGNWTINDAAFKALTGATGTFSLAVNGNSLDLTYTPIPEPSAYAAMVGLGAVGLALYRRRRQSGNEAKAA